MSEPGEKEYCVRLRVAIVVSHPIQYMCPMYQEIAADDRLDLLVIFAEGGAGARFDKGYGRVVKWQDNILDGYAYRIVEASDSERNRAVVEELKKFQPDVMHVTGYHRPYARAALRWAHKSGIATMITTDSELLHPRPLHVRAVKMLTLPGIFRRIDQFLTMGDENGRYYEHYGASKESFTRLSWPIDSTNYDGFLARREEIRRVVREREGIPADAVAILCVGKLIPRKAQADLIQALSEAIRGGKRSAILMLAGDGPDRAALEALAKPVASAVRFLGFVDVNRLPECYLAADIYAHPATRDPHPVAISEALYCSLPVVVSDLVGSTGPTDDVQPGRNGWVHPAGDVAALSRILADLIDHPEKRAAAGRISRELGMLHRADHLARQFALGAERALAARKRSSH
jgi:glycosyltransferase involved in cell wall biosynthesis